MKMNKNIKYMPAQTIKDLERLDKDEIVNGYLDGFNSRPNLNKNRSYSHGYMTGTSDKTGKVNNWQRKLANKILNEINTN